MFCNAAVFSMLGLGGGVLYTPIQVLFGIDFHTAATTSLFLIIITSLSATLVFRKSGRVDWPMALVLESSTVAGAFCGGLFSEHFSGRSLTILFAAVIVFAAVFMVRDFNLKPVCKPEDNRPLIWHRSLGSSRYCINLFLALPLSFVAGALSGTIGVAGGILKIPMMVLLFGVPMDIAVASSSFMVGLTAAGGFLGHLSVGHWDWKTTALLTLIVFAGGQLGARISLNIDNEKMKKGFGWFLYFMAILLVVRLWL
ncbi:MAG: sulfite exporter TauE/SafE family protein [Candidatus Glassbacteria bacterium]